MATIEASIIRIVVVDDRELVRQALQIYLETEPDLEIVGCADNGSTAMEIIAELAPDLVILDLEMPGMGALTALEAIRERFPRIKTLVLSGHDEREYINQAIAAGAKGYLLKGTPPEEIANTLRNVSKGYFQLGPGLLEKLVVNLSVNPIVNNPNIIREKMTRLFKNFKLEIENQTKNIVDQQGDIISKQLDKKIDLKVHNLRTKQAESNFNIQKLEQKFNILLVTPIIILFIFLLNLFIG